MHVYVCDIIVLVTTDDRNQGCSYKGEGASAPGRKNFRDVKLWNGIE